METPVIESARLRLDAVTPADADAVFEYCQDEELQRWIPVPQPYTRESAEFYAGDYAGGAALSDTLTLWAIRLRAAGSDPAETGNAPLLGVIELRFEPLASATVGFWLGPVWRGRGYMTEALRAITDHALDERGLALDRIAWNALVGNTASAIVAQRAGFRYEGIARRGLVHRDARVDGWTASILKDDPREPAAGWPL
jgi:RimJ/RimL family protein N-acetyltransferase